MNHLDEPERALVAWYLFAYGNECTEDSDKVKCTLLEKLNIKDECNAEHVAFLKKWLSKNVMIKFKLNKCPVLPIKGGIQNTIEVIRLSRQSNKLTIAIKVKGLNTLQEKMWNIEQTTSYLIKEGSLVEIKE